MITFFALFSVGFLMVAAIKIMKYQAGLKSVIDPVETFIYIIASFFIFLIGWRLFRYAKGSARKAAVRY